MKKAEDSTRQFFDQIVKEYRKNNENNIDDGETMFCFVFLYAYNFHKKCTEMH